MIHIESLTKAYPTKTLFSGASIHLRPETRVGLVGRNGTGKTTLLRMIAGEDAPDAGVIRTRPRLRIGYLPQELDTPADLTVLQAAHRDAYPEHEAKRILSGLGFRETDWSKPLGACSGGYRMRAALGHLLLSRPDVLMLDEPTNHLDQPAQAWCESFLLAANATLLIISHDTRFLDRVTTHTWEIRDHRVREYRGNHSAFRSLRAQLDAQHAATARRQAKEVERVRQFTDRFRAKATKAKQVQSRIKQLEKIKLLETRRAPKRLRFRFPQPAQSGVRVLELHAARKHYGATAVYDGLDFSVECGQRVALVGENGAGKSTLLKMLAGVLPLDAGTRREGHGVTLHYFAQHQAESLNPEHTILESLIETAPRAETNFLRGIAGVFLFSGDDQKKPVKALSGGERNRVALARMLVEPANTLLLDEPTNHLDPGSVDVLTDALAAFQGTIVFISHDPTFLNRIATRVVDIEAGRATDYCGDYEYYLWKRSQELAAARERDAPPADAARRTRRRAAAETPAKTPADTPTRRDMAKTVNRLDKQVAGMEREIAAQEARLKTRADELADPALYQDFPRWNALHQEHERWKRDLDVLTNRWAAMAAELEALKHQLARAGSPREMTQKD